jgi:hypothetical protein
MCRLVLVPVLVCALLASGCTHPTTAEKVEAPAPQQPAAPDDAGDTLRRFSRQDHWIENYPVLNATVGATSVVVAGVAACVGGVAYILLSIAAHSEGQSNAFRP